MARITSDEILSGDISTGLRRMTVPMVLGLTVTFLFQAVDTYFVGLLGTTELAAISFTFPVTFSLTSILLGFGIGTSVVLAKAIGEKNITNARRIATSGLLLAAITTFLVSLLGYLFSDSLFRLLGAEESTLPLIHEYMGPLFLGLVLFTVPMVGGAVIRATGDTKWPSLIMVLSGLVNVVLDPILIFGFGPIPAMGIKGAAIATIMAWLVGTGAGLWVLVVRERLLTTQFANVAQMLAYWRTVITTALPIILANMLNPIAIGILTAMLAKYGEHAVAAFGAGSRIESISLVACLALTSALSPFMAQNIGAGNAVRGGQALKTAIKFALKFQLAMYAVILLLSPWLSTAFSDDPAVVELTRLFLLIMPLGACFNAGLMMINTGFNSAGNSSKTLGTNIVRLMICVIPAAWLGSIYFGVTGFFVGAVVGNFLALVFAWTLLKSTYDSSDGSGNKKGLDDNARPSPLVL